MNIYKACISAILIVFLWAQAFAATRVVDDITWTSTEVTSNYNEASKTVTMFVSLNENTTPANNYILELRVLGRRAEENFVYNEISNSFSAIMTISAIDIEKNPQSYSLRIKDTRKNTFYIINQAIGNDTTPVVSSSLNFLSPVRQAEANKIVADVLKNIPASDNTATEQRRYLDSVVIKLEAYNKTNSFNADIISNVILQLSGQDYVVVPNTPTTNNNPTRFTPKYQNKSEEPNKINGIGNNPNYSSWRVWN